MNQRPECIDIWQGASFGKEINFVQMKSLWSSMALPQGLKILHTSTVVILV